MNYIRFINSRDIREYLYGMDYKLTGEQKLFLIVNSFRVTFEEKIAALESLLDTPDEEVIIRNQLFMKNKDSTGSEYDADGFEHLSLHEMIVKIVRYHKRPS